MRYHILIILINYSMVQCLKGTIESICYGHARVGKPIAIGPNLTEIIYDRQPFQTCCQGYSEVDGVCEPVCEPLCVFGNCTAPNVCTCDPHYVEPLCDELLCPVGYTGDYCEEECPSGTYGSNCENICECVHGNCDSGTGYCDCYVGWQGTTCSECSCSNNGVCDSWTGICECPAGYVGRRCEDECDQGYWGMDCAEICNCKNDSCDAITGKCVHDCAHGRYANDTCICDNGWAGETCDIQCRCVNGDCNFFGECECYDGWRGATCEETCEGGRYGPGCAMNCTWNALDNFICDPIRGDICMPGYIGPHCKDLCPEGTYGSGCQPCSCINASKCNKFTGECECYPGWYGIKCDTPCLEGTFGMRCEHRCPCPKCRPTDGFCPCQEGWNGTHCQDYCPVEFFSLITKQCVDIELARFIQVDPDTFIVIAVALALAVLLLLCGVVVVIVCISKAIKKERTDERPRSYGPLLYRREERPTSHIYEEIPEGNTYDHYNRLLHVPVENGYLPPKEVPTLVQNTLPVGNEYVTPRNLRRTYFISRNTLPKANSDHQWRSDKVKSAI